jgi:3-dehydroquinate dehydratase/shikimate dehydrogenase
MTRLIASICASDQAGMVAAARDALANGADWVELRLDGLPAGDDVDWPGLSAGLSGMPWLATVRSLDQGGACRASLSDRRQLLSRALAAGASGLDIELGDLAETGPEDWPGAGEKVMWVVSHHDLAGMPADARSYPERVRSVAGRHDAVAKLAWTGRDISENFAAFEMMRSQPNGCIAIVMGEKGLPARVLAKKFGAFGTFCASGEGHATAPGQVPLARMRDTYEWSRQTKRTRVFGVLGAPVAHSLSPLVFNDAFAESGEDGVYLPWRVDTADELTGFLNGCRARPWLDVGGFSVTVPHKETALRWVKDAVEPLARRIGAINTLHFGAEGVRGFNTDYAGALDALAAGLGWDDTALGGLPVAVLGAGGVARAIVAGLTDRGADVWIYNRSGDRADALAREFGCRSQSWERRADHVCRLVVNCTSLGMTPHIETTPMPRDGLRSQPAVFDTVYNPRATLLLKQAQAAGCRVVDGVSMFVRQAAAQYRIWTGRAMDVARATQIVSERLDRAAG